MTPTATSPGPLLRAANGILSELYAQQNPGSLTITQLAVLRALKAHGPQPQTALVALAGTDRSTLSCLLPVLEAKGFVERERTAADVRVRLVTITIAGTRAIGDAASALKVAEGILLRRVPKRHREAFLIGLASISEGSQS